MRLKHAKGVALFITLRNSATYDHAYLTLNCDRLPSPRTDSNFLSLSPNTPTVF